jgi:hypothetical protein
MGQLPEHYHNRGSLEEDFNHNAELGFFQTGSVRSPSRLSRQICVKYSSERDLSWPVISRPLSGDVPTIDLVVGHNKANASPIPKLSLSRIDHLIARVSSKRPAVKP